MARSQYSAHPCRWGNGGHMARGYLAVAETVAAAVIAAAALENGDEVHYAVGAAGLVVGTERRWRECRSG